MRSRPALTLAKWLKHWMTGRATVKRGSSAGVSLVRMQRQRMAEMVFRPFSRMHSSVL